MGAYDDNASKLFASGIMPLPITPAEVTYVAKKSPVVFDPFQNRYVNLADWPTMTTPVTRPQPKAGIGARCGDGLVAMDYDDDEAAVIISAVFPESVVNKEGQKGFTAFYSADFDVPSEVYYAPPDGKRVLEILYTGRQTVIPPSIHPDTMQPYRWTNGHSLYDTRPQDLPRFPADYKERLAKLGYTQKQKPKDGVETFDPETGEIEEGFSDSKWRDLNTLALKRLDDWVHDLGLFDLKRNPGRGASFRSVASFRASRTGRPNEQRDRNLNIHPRGITDTGDDHKPYTAINLVMVCLGLTTSEAYEWLEEKLGEKKPELEIDIDKIIEAQDAPKTAPEDDAAADTNDAGYDDASDLVGREWEDGDPIPAPLPMLIPYFVPLEPYLGYLWGQSQTYKTFLLNTMAVAVASGTRFAGYQVTERGLVYQVELEGSRSQLRIQAAKQFAGITDKLPIVHVTKTPPSLIGAGKRVSIEWKKWAGQVVAKAKMAAERHDVPLKLITIDPQNHFAGFTDEQSSAEGNVVCNALIAMAKDAGCPVLVADHLGKNAEAGGRGTSVKHQSPWFILDAGESAEELGEDRVLIIRKMKDGEDGIGISFHVEKFSAEIDEQVRSEEGKIKTQRAEHETLIVVFEGEVRPVNTIKASDANKLTDKEQIVFNSVNSMLNTEGAELPAECGQPKGLRGIHLSRLQVRVTRNPSFAGKGRGAALFQRTVDGLMAKRKIEGMDEWIWVPPLND